MADFSAPLLMMCIAGAMLSCSESPSEPEFSRATQSVPTTESADGGSRGSPFLARDRSPRLLLSMDHHLLQADFMGEVTVQKVYQSESRSGVRAELLVTNRWASRWPASALITIGIDDWGSYRNVIVEGNKLVVFLSGGPWTGSPLTFRNNSLFRVGSDEIVECATGHKLFGVHNGGFVCSAQEFMPVGPMFVGDMRVQTLAMRQRAALRLPDLDARLASAHRALMLVPTAEESIDRSQVENEVFR